MTLRFAQCRINANSAVSPFFYRLTAELFIINLAESRFFLTLRKVINTYHEGNRQKIRDWANPEVV